MRARALRIADELAAAAPDGHRRPGGRRGHRAAALAGRRPLHLPRLPRVRPATDGDGEDDRLLAGARHRPGHPARRPAQDRRRSAGSRPRSAPGPGSPSCCIVTKANSRSTVHRPAYLDYVGVKTFDAGRRGHRASAASSGCSPPRPTPRASRRIPVLRRKAVEVLARSGLRAGQPLRQGPAADPGDLPARRAVPDRRPTTWPGPRWPCCTCRSAARLGCSCAATTTAGSCPAWSTCRATATRPRSGCAMEEILREAFDGASVDYTARVSESVLARLHFVVRVAPAHDRARRRPGRGRGAAGRATRTWDDDFADALRDSCGRRRRPALAGVYGRGVPRGLQGGLARRRRRWPTCAGSRRCSSDGDIDLKLYAPPGAAPGERRFKLFRVGAAGVAVPRAAAAAAPGRRGRRRAAVRGRAPRPARRLGLRLRPALRAGAASGRGDGRPATRFQDAFAAVWAGEAESDGFNALVLRAGLTWRQAMVLRAYAKYLRQAGSTFSQDYVEECLRPNAHIAAAAGRALRGAVRPDALRARRRRVRGAGRRADRGDRRRARRRGQPRPGPDPALLPRR